MVRLKKDDKAMPFPRRLTRMEQERFWRKLEEDVMECGEIMPNATSFQRNFADLTYDSFNEAVKYYRQFKNSICKGEEPKIPDKYTRPLPLGESLEDEIVIVTGRLYSNNKNCSIEAIIEEVYRVRGTRPSKEKVKDTIKRVWRQSKGIILENEEKLSWFMIVNIPKECLEKIIEETLSLYEKGEL